jgi:heat shock protein HslJ
MLHRHRRSATATLSAVLLALAVSACSMGGEAPGGGLEGTSWVVESIGGASPAPASAPTMIFGEDGSVSGSSGCNQYSGTFRTDGDAITISQLASTMMACEDERMAVEAAFSAALSGSSAWRLGEDGRLTLSGASDIVASEAAG